jgi:hypothetical protein
MASVEKGEGIRHSGLRPSRASAMDPVVPRHTAVRKQFPAFRRSPWAAPLRIGLHRFISLLCAAKN